MAFLDGQTQLFLIAVDFCSVEVVVSQLDCALDGVDEITVDCTTVRLVPGCAGTIPNLLLGQEHILAKTAWNQLTAGISVPSLSLTVGMESITFAILPV